MNAVSAVRFHRGAWAIALAAAALAGCGSSKSELPSFPLSAQVVGPSEVLLSWSPPEDVLVSDYRVYRDGVGETRLAATRRSYRDLSARPNTRHTYSVNAVLFPLGTVARAVRTVRTSPFAEWTTTDVAPGRLGALALDSAGDPHVLLTDPAGDLVYGRPSDVGFVFETVEAVGGGAVAGLGVGPGDVVQAVWSGAGGELRHGTRSGGAWTLETVAPGDVEGVALRVEPSGDLLMAFGIFGESGTVRLARLRAAAWTIETVSRPGQSRVGVARDAAGRIHVGHASGGSLPFLYHSIEDGAGFPDRAVVDDVRAAAGPESLADGSVVFALMDRPSFDVRLAFVDAGGDTLMETVDVLSWIGGDISIAVDDVDGVHIAYEDASYNLRYAFRDPDGAVTVLHLDAEGGIGARNRIAVDAAQRVFVLHEDRGRGWVRLSRSP